MSKRPESNRSSSFISTTCWDCVCTSTNPLTFARKSSGITGTEIIVDSAAFVSFKPIQIRHVYSGDKYHRGLLKPRMLANRVRQFKPVHFRHVHVYEHDSHFIFQQLFESLPRRGGVNQVLA